jgi:hypothetical protein
MNQASQATKENTSAYRKNHNGLTETLNYNIGHNAVLELLVVAGGAE